MWFLFFLRDFVSVPALLIGIFCLIGAIVQRYSFAKTLTSVFRVIIGFTILGGGAGILVGSLNQFQPIFQAVYGLRGLVPNNEAFASSLAGTLSNISTMSSLIMIIGMLLNIVLALVSRFKYVFLTGHQMYFMAFLFGSMMYLIGFDFSKPGDYAMAIIAGSAFQSCWMIFSPAICQRWMRQLIVSDEVAMGHAGGLGFALSGWIGEAIAFGSKGTLKVIKVNVSPDSSGWKRFWARALPRRVVRGEDVAKARYRIRSTESINFPKWLAFFKNSIISTTLVIFVFYLVAFLPGGILYEIDKSRLSKAALDVLGSKNWVVVMIVAAFTFTAGLEVLMMGVRMFIAELIGLFKGISERLVKKSKVGVDCPVVFPYAPNAVLIGFLCTTIANYAGMAITIGLNSGGLISITILPLISNAYFVGATSGVFGNVKGGIFGTIISSTIVGLIMIFVPVILYEVGWAASRIAPPTADDLAAGYTSLSWVDVDFIWAWVPGVFGLASKFAALGIALALFFGIIGDGLLARYKKWGPYKPAPPAEEAKAKALAAAAK